LPVILPRDAVNEVRTIWRSLSRDKTGISKPRQLREWAMQASV